MGLNPGLKGETPSLPECQVLCQEKHGTRVEGIWGQVQVVKRKKTLWMLCVNIYIYIKAGLRKGQHSPKSWQRSESVLRTEEAWSRVRLFIFGEAEGPSITQTGGMAPSGRVSHL